MMPECSDSAGFGLQNFNIDRHNNEENQFWWWWWWWEERRL
jgi:hypothetical protein